MLVVALDLLYITIFVYMIECSLYIGSIRIQCSHIGSSRDGCKIWCTIWYEINLQMYACIFCRLNMYLWFSNTIMDGLVSHFSTWCLKVWNAKNGLHLIIEWWHCTQCWYIVLAWSNEGTKVIVHEPIYKPIPICENHEGVTCTQQSGWHFFVENQHFLIEINNKMNTFLLMNSTKVLIRASKSTFFVYTMSKSTHPN